MIDLRGKTILLTRASEDAEAWTRVIEERGGRAVHLPCLSCELLGDPETVRSFRAALDGADWLVLTSRRGVVAAAKLLDRPMPEGIQVAAVGESTADEARRRFGRCDFVAGGGTGRALAEELLRILESNGGARGPRVVVASADRAARHLEEVLGPAGAELIRIVVYRTTPAPEATYKEDLAAYDLDAILLASPSAARGLLNIARLPAGVPVLSIGPTTTEAARSLGIEVNAEAERPAIESLLEALKHE